MMDSKFLDFLRNKINSFVKWDLVRFFHDNPHTKDTLENIACYTSREPQVIARELDELVTVGVLVVEDISGVRVYRLTQDTAVREIIDQFMVACNDREFRVEAIHQVIEGMQFTARHDY